jgi:hypothetical protein
MIGPNDWPEPQKTLAWMAAVGAFLPIVRIWNSFRRKQTEFGKIENSD